MTTRCSRVGPSEIEEDHETMMPTSQDSTATENDAPVPPADPMARLDTVSERPLHEHADLYDEIHARLQAALAEIDA